MAKSDFEKMADDIYNSIDIDALMKDEETVNMLLEVAALNGWD